MKGQPEHKATANGQTMRTHEIQLKLPEDLFTAVQELSEGGELEETLVSMIREATEAKTRARESEAPWTAFRKRAEAFPLEEIVSLARNDGSTKRVSIRLPASIVEWLEERQRALRAHPKAESFYDGIDVSTALRHTLAQVLCTNTPLAKPSKGGEPNGIHLSNKLIEALLARLDRLRTENPEVRENAGLSTIIQYALAGAMQEAERRAAERKRRRKR